MTANEIIDTSDIVWAQMKYCSSWPARIVTNPPDEIKAKGSAKQICVFFFGTKNYGFVELQNISSYFQNRLKYRNKRKSKMFQKSVQQCEEFLSDPKKYYHHAVICPEDNCITVQTEHSFYVKEEPKDPEDQLCHVQSISFKTHPIKSNLTKRTKPVQIPQNKSEPTKLQLAADVADSQSGTELTELRSCGPQPVPILCVSETLMPGCSLATLKQIRSENDNLVAQLETARVALLKQEATQKNSEEKYQHEFNYLKQLVREKNAEIARVGAAKRKADSELIGWQNKHAAAARENIHLKAQVQQMKASCTSSKPIKSKDENNSYDVEHLLEHKKTNGQLYFLIQWGNTWEPERNLSCPAILRKYKKEHNLR